MQWCASARAYEVSKSEAGRATCGKVWSMRKVLIYVLVVGPWFVLGLVLGLVFATSGGR